MNKTDEYSFILKQSSIPKAGIGVFAAHDIAKGTHLRLFGDKALSEQRIRTLHKRDIPEIFQDFCKDRGRVMICPQDFGQMAMGWYLNHSNSPNAKKQKYDWYASRNIKEGEEILIDYNTLNEPENSKDEYYNQ